MSRSVLYTSSPLLASKTPVWRSKFIVAVVALGFLGLAARAAYIQVVANAFFQRQGEVRFARTLELPASRGRILDRNGQILAISVSAPTVSGGWGWPLWWSLEIASIEGNIYFFIRCEPKNKETIENLIYAQFPQAEVTEVDDYTKYVPSYKGGNGWEFQGAEYVLKEVFIPDPKNDKDRAIVQAMQGAADTCLVWCATQKAHSVEVLSRDCHESAYNACYSQLPVLNSPSR